MNIVMSKGILFSCLFNLIYHAPIYQKARSVAVTKAAREVRMTAED